MITNENYDSFLNKRGKPCWYKLLGVIVVNLKNRLKEHFRRDHICQKRDQSSMQ